MLIISQDLHQFLYPAKYWDLECLDGPGRGLYFFGVHLIALPSNMNLGRLYCSELISCSTFFGVTQITC